jgi:hypothetical protein
LLTPEQANAAADALLREKRTELERERDSKAIPVPFYYRSAELSRLPRWRQAELLAESKQEVQSQSVVWGLVAALVVGFVALVALGAFPWRGKISALAVLCVISAISTRFVLVSSVLRRKLSAKAAP